MLVKFVEENSDYEGPVLDIQYTNTEEAFALGVVFQEAIALNKCVWKGNNFLRIPLIEMTNIGTAKI
jgi:hypothetical protein